MRIPLALAWLLLGMVLFTAGLLRQFHDLTPSSPFLNPAIGSLLFACVVFLALVAVRERQIGAAPGPGIRLGSLTPFLLMLLGEKWLSSLYGPIFAWATPADLEPVAADAGFRALCGVGLLLIVLLTSRFSNPARAFLASRLAPRRALPGIGAAAVAVLCSVAALGALALAFGSFPRLLPPASSGPHALVIAGQSVLALAEEAWFRGLLLGELLRLAPRLGLRHAASRRWVAIGTTALLFGFEHFSLQGGIDDGVRQLVFALALGTLFGMLVLVTSNLWFVAALHAFVNLLLLGALPQLAYGAGASAAPLSPGVTISLVLIAAFIAAFLAERRGYARTASSQSS